MYNISDITATMVSYTGHFGKFFSSCHNYPRFCWARCE
uniref:Uncharacterized protein n=1 Tax=Manihot esculenta TaxID=3983 RepID=A0A2C9W935_MANES